MGWRGRRKISRFYFYLHHLFCCDRPANHRVVSKGTSPQASEASYSRAAQPTYRRIFFLLASGCVVFFIGIGIGTGLAEGIRAGLAILAQYLEHDSRYFADRFFTAALAFAGGYVLHLILRTRTGN